MNTQTNALRRGLRTSADTSAIATIGEAVVDAAAYGFVAAVSIVVGAVAAGAIDDEMERRRNLRFQPVVIVTYGFTNVSATTAVAGNLAAAALRSSDRMHHEITAQIAELRRVGDNWDGDGAPAPNAIAFANATRVLAALRLLETAAECDLEADALGGLAFGFYVAGEGDRDRLRAYIECLNKGTVHLVLDDRTVDDGVRSRMLDLDRLDAVVDELRAFLAR